MWEAVVPGNEGGWIPQGERPRGGAARSEEEKARASPLRTKSALFSAAEERAL